MNTVNFLPSILKVETTRIHRIPALSPIKKKTVQEETLLKLLHQAKHTEFGMIHDFKNIYRADDIIKTFQESVPLFNYETYFDHWIKRALNGETDLIWPGIIKNFALSSGTTKGGSKYIPISDHMLRQFKKTSYQQVSEYSGKLSGTVLLKTKALIIGGSTKLRYEGNVRVGDLSGILAKNKSWVFSSFSKPGKKTGQITDWEEKMNRIVDKAPKWNIGVIAGVPSWVSLLLEKIIKKYQLQNIHEIWPNLQLYVHGGVFLDPYKEKIDKMCGKSLLYQNTYLASEGYFGYQKDFSSSEMTLLTRHGVFYEFVDSDQFELIRSGQMSLIQPISLEDVQPQKSYAIIITTCAGIWRYSLGDIIVFSDVHEHKFRITGRISYNLNICGEHLSEENLSKAVIETGKRYNTKIYEFCSYPNKKKNRHEWYIGVDRSVPESEFEAYLDAKLKELNDDYNTSRKFILKRPKVKVLPIDKFYEFMSINKKVGAQSKFPRVLNDSLIRQWEQFLSNGNSFSDSLYFDK